MESLRVYYKERQRLVAADLRAEQEYLIGLDVRHNLYHHRPGIVRGLRIGIDERGRAVVEPGLAINSSGRELLLGQPSPIVNTLTSKCADVWLIYCPEPLRLRQPGRVDCSPQSFQRWKELARIILTPAEEGQDPEPVGDDAVYLGRINCKVAPEIAYTKLCGVEVAGPDGRALMQVGPRTGLDPFGFMVKVADAAGSLQRRIALDKQGNNYLYGAVEIYGHHESLSIPVLDNNSLLLMVEPASFGKQAVFKLESTRAAGNVKLKLLFEDGERKIPPENFTFDTQDSQQSKKLSDFNNTSKLVKLSLVKEAPAPEGESVRLLSVSGVQQSSLTSWGGTLELKGWPEQDEMAQDTRRGCYEPMLPSDLVGGVEPNGLSFLPVSQPIKGQPLPRIYSATVKSEDRTIEQLRFDLGPKKDADLTPRLSIGQFLNNDKKYDAWATISGSCLFTLIGGDNSKPEKPPISFDVRGFIEQSPLKPDPADPLFKNLLVIAWLAGLQSSVSASTVIEILIQNPPVLIETAKPFSYSVRINNSAGKNIDVDKVLETLTNSGQVLINNLMIPNNTIPPTGITLQVTHRANELNAGTVTIDITASGKAGEFAWWRSTAPQQPIPVERTPVADLTNVPDSVPRESPWEHHFIIQNVATRPFKLEEVTVIEGAIPMNLLHAPIDVNPGKSFTSEEIPHPGGITAALNIDFFARYKWENGPEETISETQTVQVLTQLETRFRTPAEIEINEDWKFSLTLRNISTKPLRINSLEQRLTSADFPATPFQPIPGLPTDELNPGESVLLDDIDGVKVPKATDKVTLEIRAEYEREGRILRPPAATHEINVHPPKP